MTEQKTFPDAKLGPEEITSCNPWSLKRLGPKALKKWLIKELSKVEGGLDGIVLTEVR